MLVGPAVAVVLASAGGSRRGGCWWYQRSMFAGGSGNSCLLEVCWWYRQSQLRPKGGLCAKRATVALPSQAYSAEGGPASPAWDAQRRGGKARRKHRFMEILIVLYCFLHICKRIQIHSHKFFVLGLPDPAAAKRRVVCKACYRRATVTSIFSRGGARQLGMGCPAPGWEIPARTQSCIDLHKDSNRFTTNLINSFKIIIFGPAKASCDQKDGCLQSEKPKTTTKVRSARAELCE